MSVNYSDYQGTETLLTFNFEDSLGWQLSQGRELADLTVERVWEDLESWLGPGRVMWEGQ